ncbi:mannan endo-1,4-beta-mannosidase [Pseudarcicella hirudinis]|uniref:Mannan endo-1,4-beta-mannosidase n=1 Tax=Pseudarcicella hirudinis TaxID=1079859 RepID=A0A1I5XF96_9BACT|nr:glycosyl hydrolase [Pseudarcicella hirudinis]SFQ30638.1 mannan endo-1,4-beta-mannosidase [Pseudarcicella hirudinis]
MKLKFIILLQLVVLTGFGQDLPVDKKATTETKNLYRNLKKLMKKGTMFGHQDDLAYGLNADQTRWVGEVNKSDVKSVTGQFPAVFGWDLGGLEMDQSENLDGVPFSEMKKNIVEIYQRGGVNTISWHFRNPLDPKKSAWDKQDSTIGNILRNKEALKNYTNWLDKMAVFVSDLKGPKGEFIPVIFRPFHEHTGSWFWWGKNHCSPEEYKHFWQFTVNYLKNVKNIHNLIYAYSTDVFSSKEEYLERYPGDEYADLLGFDTYHRNAPGSNETFIKNTRRMLSDLHEINQKSNKIIAITETGLERLTEEKWWTNILLPILQGNDVSYVLVWRNGRPDHFYAPYPGQASAADFVDFSRNPGIFLEKKTRTESLYKK